MSRYPRSNKQSSRASGSSSEYKLRKALFEWEKDDRGNRYRINVASLGDRQFLDLRLWYTDPETGELKPGKGLSIPIVDENIDKLLEGMDIVHEQWESGDILK